MSETRREQIVGVASSGSWGVVAVTNDGRAFRLSWEPTEDSQFSQQREVWREIARIPLSPENAA